MSVSDSDQLPYLRRVVTGHDSNGRAVIQSDRTIASKASDLPGLEGLRAGSVWVVDAVPSNDNVISEEGATRTIPDAFGLKMPNGAAVRFTDLAPGAVAPPHRTSTLDFNILVQGQIILYAEDKTEEAIFSTPGDVVVQRGTLHSWKNPGPGWARWVTVLFDANPAVVGGRALATHWDGNDLISE